MRIIFALLSILVGLAFVYRGYRLARLLIPLIGLISGLSLGGAIVSDIGNSSFLGTFLGIFVGIILGLVLGVIAYFYYALAVIVLLGGLGYFAGSSFLLALGFNPGVLSVVTGLVLGIIFGLLALYYNAPKYVLIALTGVIGAITTIGGLMLLFNVIPLSSFSYTAINVSISDSFLWTVAAIALALVSIIYQYRTTVNYELEKWGPSKEHPSHPPTTTTFSLPH